MLSRLYPLLRPAFFALEPERSHALGLASLRLAHRLHLVSADVRESNDPLRLMGLSFPNRIGLAAGLDKDARHIDALGALGFGFIEVGTVTPRPQSGQAKPRLFRFPAQHALINRMGFPNDGAQAVASRLTKRTYAGVLGVNIGKNAATPIERAINRPLFGRAGRNQRGRASRTRRPSRTACRDLESRRRAYPSVKARQHPFAPRRQPRPRPRSPARPPPPPVRPGRHR